MNREHKIHEGQVMSKSYLNVWIHFMFSSVIARVSERVFQNSTVSTRSCNPEKLQFLVTKAVQFLVTQIKLKIALTLRLIR